jgi:hypothetical protein
MKKSVLVLAAVIVAVAGGSAEAAHLITSSDIQNGTIRGKDIHKGTISLSKFTTSVQKAIKNGTKLRVQQGPAGPGGANGTNGNNGNNGRDGRDLTLTPSNWGIIDRNTIGSPDMQLRQGPATPPLGIGSLNMLVGNGSEKAAYGNEVDFNGNPLSGLTAAGFSVYQTGEDQDGTNGGAGNLPNIDIEVNPHVVGHTFSTLVFVPSSTAASNAWTKFTQADGQWYYSGSFGSTTPCNQTTMCTFAAAKAAAPNAIIQSVAVAKGRDDAWQGAIDALQINSTKYNFEPTGVIAGPAS